MTARLARWARAWRSELAIAAIVTVARAILGNLVAAGVAELIAVAAGIAIVASPRSRARATQVLVDARHRRRWEAAIVGVWPAPATPKLLSFGQELYGPWVQVRVAPGSTVDDLGRRAGHLGAWLAVQTVRVNADPANAALAVIQALCVDPLAAAAARWPWADAASTNIWEPVPVGIDEAGRAVTIALAGHNLLIGGEPGSGKSVALSQLVAAAALDPDAAMFLLDGKLVELAAWAGAADGFAGTDIAQATELLRHVQRVMEARYQWLLDTARRKIDPGTSLAIVVIDELAHYLTWADKKPRDGFSDVLRDLVSRGRAAGVVVIAATQKPSTDIIPSSLRDLFGYRWALRCTTAAASDTILGSGAATNGYSASAIAPSLRGGGYLLHESGVPIRCRAHHLGDDDIAALARRARDLRASSSRATQLGAAEDSDNDATDVGPEP